MFDYGRLGLMEKGDIVVSNKVVLIEKKGRICTVTLNRPEIMNAFNPDMLEGLQEAFLQIASDDEIRVVICTGAKGNFSSGADLSTARADMKAESPLKVMKRVKVLVRTIREIPQPIIAKVRGTAYGIGANLALAGDFVLAAHDARFCEVFVNIGATLDGGGTYFLPRLVGLVKAREIALLGNEIDGKTAANIGLIYKSTSDEDLDKEVESLAQILSQKSLPAMAMTKEGLESSFNMSLSEALEWEASNQVILMQSEENKEAVRNYLISRGKIE